MNATNISVPLSPPHSAPALAGSMTEALAGSLASRWRRWFFRCVRLTAAGALLSAGAYLGQHALNKVESDQAYLNATITALRAPIAGQVQLEQLEPGTPVTSGTTLFRVENPRFGNLEAMSQLNWMRDLVDRLHAELADAEVRFARQEQVFKHHETLFNEKLIARLEFLEEETKVAICRAAVTQKRDQAHSAERRVHEVEQHLALQKQAAVTMPFDGVVWAVREQNGGEVAVHESVAHVIDPKRLWVDAFVHEKHADKFQVGTPVVVHTVDGHETWPGHVESIRAGVGRIDPESFVAVPPGDLARRRVALRVRLDAAPPFTAAQFFGVGRSVVVSLPSTETARESLLRLSRAGM